MNTAVRLKWFPIWWGLMWPLRVYLRRFPWAMGKGFITRRVLKPMLPPPPATFEASLACGARLNLQFREVIGLATLLRGGFEPAEMEFLRDSVRPGTTFVDVGANVGIYSVAMASAVGPLGRVMAFEPVSENVERLRKNLQLNQLSNVRIFQSALGDWTGTIELKLASDPAYPSMVEVAERRGTGLSRRVPISRLDDLWEAAGCPAVSAMKIDVEGAEMMVLRGSERLLARCAPKLQVEANTARHLDELIRWLQVRGYRHQQPAGFMPWNHIFSTEKNLSR